MLRAPRRQLHRDKEVLFAGYKLPHPLEYCMLVKVQTRGRRTPRDVVDAALTDLVDEFVDMKAKFQARTAGRQRYCDALSDCHRSSAGRVGEVPCMGSAAFCPCSKLMIRGVTAVTPRIRAGLASA